MGAASKIEWTDHTFNPWIGCTEVSPACDECYARDLAKRYGWAAWGPGEPRHRTGAATWRAPFQWNEAAPAFKAKNGHWPRVFCASLADVFDNEVPTHWREELFDVIRATPNLRWQLLTKRIGNAPRMLPPDWPTAFPHVGLMATVATQEEVRRDVPKLLATPAAWRGLSCEPLLERIEIPQGMLRNWECRICGFGPDECNWAGEPEICAMCAGDGLIAYKPGGIDWVICGGESGRRARPMHPDWARALREQCKAAGVPFLFKQWGEFLPLWRSTKAGERDGKLDFSVGIPMERVGKKAAGRELDGRAHDQFPKLLEAA